MLPRPSRSMVLARGNSQPAGRSPCYAFREFKQIMSGNSTLRVPALALCMVGCLRAADDNSALRITSEPSGAHVIINGRDRGTTPFEVKLGNWAFDIKKSSVFSKHLSEPWVLQISKDGYRT